MSKIFKRFIAYIIDMMVILIITQCLTGIPQINWQLDNYNKYYNEYLDLYKEYAYFKTNINKYFEDKELTLDEYNNLINEYTSYKDTLDEYYIDGELSDKNYDKLNKEIDDNYNNTYKELYYKIEKNSVMYFIIYLVAVIAYFIGFNKYTKGQTLGKKLMRLKIVNSNDENKDVPVWKFIVRSIILYQPIYYIVKLIGISFMGINMYYDITNIVYNVQGYLEMLIIAMVMIRLDGRGPQDLLARTRVALYDRNGNEVKDKMSTKFEEKMKEIKSSSKKVIDEEVIDDKNTYEEQTIKKEKSTKKRKSKKVIDEEPTE